MRPNYKIFRETVESFLDKRLDKTRYEYQYYNLKTLHYKDSYYKRNRITKILHLHHESMWFFYKHYGIKYPHLFLIVPKSNAMVNTTRHTMDTLFLSCNGNEWSNHFYIYQPNTYSWIRTGHHYPFHTEKLESICKNYTKKKTFLEKLKTYVSKRFRNK